jgi:hypothetical protein
VHTHSVRIFSGWLGGLEGRMAYFENLSFAYLRAARYHVLDHWSVQKDLKLAFVI